MAEIRNPFFSPFAGLLTAGQRVQIKTDLVTFFQANSDRVSIPENEVRAAITVPLSEIMWQRVRARIDELLG